MTPRLTLPWQERDPHDELPSRELRLLETIYRTANGGAKPRTLREHFCGALADCCAWVRLGPERRAVGVDPDSAKLAQGCAHNRARLRPPQQVRVHVLRDDVFRAGLPQADIIAALGVSHFVLKTRAELLTYFRNCLQTLEPGGMLAVDCIGGTAVQTGHEHEREEAGGTHSFRQEWPDPLTHEAGFHILFKRRGAERARPVSTYDWRVWGLPELKETLLDAGFSDVRIYWPVEPEGDGEVDYVPVEHVEKEPSSWTSYVVGFR